ncbi:MAG TPA: PhzF family phenazine biosynthesis isomerase [Mobilitalea sp.]|nr:PhzF family phenazine biosynthesis isomerase [Mobilitalea sp.]
MKEIKVYHYDAFTVSPNKGNPAGVVFGADNLTTEEMQTIAKKVGFNETSFILKSDRADLRIRFFTPGHEMELCGHGTVAAVYGLMEQGLIAVTTDITIETLAGMIHVNYNDELKEVRMSQAPAKFLTFDGDKNLLAASLGITIDDMHESYPIVYGSTGIWTLIVPIKNLNTFLGMHPKNKQFPEVLKQIPTASIHPICLETYNKTCDMHGRHFSAPRSGTVEDPVTGTASGVMGAYYVTYINPMDQAELQVEQGYEIGKKGVVRVFVSRNKNEIVSRNRNEIEVSIAGKAVYVDEYMIEI